MKDLAIVLRSMSFLTQYGASGLQNWGTDHLASTAKKNRFIVLENPWKQIINFWYYYPQAVKTFQ